MKNSVLFLEKFNEIENYLKKNKNDRSFNGFAHLLKILAKQNKILSLFYDDLREFAQLRNAIVHNRRYGDEVIAEPADFVVREITKIAALLNNPPKFLEVVGQKEVTFLQIDDKLIRAINLMSEKSYSQIPIYSGSNFTEVLSSNTIVRLLGKENEIELNEVKISEALVHKNKLEICEFVSETVDLGEIITIFENEQKNRDKQKIEAVLVTKKGSRSEFPIGIVTHTDLPGIYRKLNL